MSTIPDEQAVVALLRDRLLLPNGQLEDEVRPFYPGDVPDLFVAPLFDGDHGRVAIVYAPDGMPRAHGGFARAAARLERLQIFGDGGEWARAHTRQLLDAVGGLTPGLYPYVEQEVHASRDGVGLELRAPVPWVEFAASGARGIPPSVNDVPDPRGITPPAELASMRVTIGTDFSIAWEYEGSGAGFSGRAADEVVSSDEPDDLLAERLVAAVRRDLPSPLAMPARPPRRIRQDALTTTWSVELLGHRPVEITEAGGNPQPLER